MRSRLSHNGLIVLIGAWSLLCTAANSQQMTIGSDLGSKSETLNCLQDHVTITSAEIQKSDLIGNDIIFDVTNQLAWPIAGIRIAYQGYSEGRSIAWIEDDVSMGIAGGIEPGETRTLRTNAFLPAEAPENLIIQAQVIDVADQYKRQLIRDVRVSGWADMKSEQPCP